MKFVIFTLLIILQGFIEAKVDLEKICLNSSNGEVLSHPLDCRGYIVCGDYPSEEYCELGFHFDPMRKVCNWPENVNCQLNSQSEIKDDTSVKSNSALPLLALDVLTGEVVDPLTAYTPLNVICRHLGAYFLPNPKQCRNYYLCAYGHMHELSCARGTLWDYGKHKCVLNFEANCYYRSLEEELEIVNSLTLNKDNLLEVCYPVQENSTTGMTTTEFTLSPTTEKFHPTGSSYTRTTEESTQPMTTTSIPQTITDTTPTTAPKPFEIICPAKRQSYVAHPQDCSKYFMCIAGTPVMTSCPVGLLWDAKREYCDLVQNVKCFSKKNSKI